MRGEKTITFDFPIRYSENGKFEEAYTITVRAPGLGKYDVYTAMQSYVGKGIISFIKARGDVAKPDEDEYADNDAASPDEEKGEEDVMAIMAIGLDTKMYQEFATYTRRAITNAPKLATIGEGKAPLSDAVWEELADKGGMEAINRVLSEFVSFFLDALGSKKKSGPAKSVSSSSPTRAVSVSSEQKGSRTRKSSD